MQDLQDLWEKVLAKMQKKLSAISYDLWISTLQLLDFKNNKLILFAPSPSAKTQILKNHKDQLQESITEVFENDDISFEILDKKEKEEYQKQNLTNTQEKIENNFEEKKQFNEKYTFDNFVVGKSNQFCYAAAKAVAENPGKSFNPLFIYGGVGLGKTHLLHAIGNFIRQNNKDMKIAYVTCEQFTNDYIDSLGVTSNKDKATLEFREKYRKLDVLMVDDIQFISNKTSTQEEFFHTFNDLYQNNKQIIISSDRPPKEIATLEERLRSRFSCGLIQDVQQPDYETRIAILKKKVQLEKYFVKDEVIEYIAEKVSTNVREMEGILTKIYFFATLTGKSVATIEDAENVLKEEVDLQKEKLTADIVIDAVCEYFKVAKSDIVGKKKTKEIVEPRMVAIYLIDELLDIPLVNIGKMFGGRDHTTIMHSRDKITEALKNDKYMKEVIYNIKKKI